MIYFFSIFFSFLWIFFALLTFWLVNYYKVHSFIFNARNSNGCALSLQLSRVSYLWNAITFSYSTAMEDSNFIIKLSIYLKKNILYINIYIYEQWTHKIYIIFLTNYTSSFTWYWPRILMVIILISVLFQNISII